MKVISLDGTDCKLEIIHQNKLKTSIIDHLVYPKPMLMVNAIILNRNNIYNINTFYLVSFCRRYIAKYLL